MVETEGLASAQKVYEISKSLDFEWDFVISELISGFQVRFQDFDNSLQEDRIDGLHRLKFNDEKLGKKKTSCFSQSRWREEVIGTRMMQCCAHAHCVVWLPHTWQH